MHALFLPTFGATDARLRIDGELDIAAHDWLRNHLADLLDLSSGTVTLDLGGISFIDSTCLSTIDGLRRELRTEHRGFEISDASLTFRLVCSLAGFDELARTISGGEVTPLGAARRRTQQPRRATVRHGQAPGS